MDSGDLLFKQTALLDHLRDDALSRAQLILDAYGLMECNALNIGLHDLSAGPQFLLDMEQRVGFPFLSANLVFEDTNKLVFKPYHIHETPKGMRIGILGLITAKSGGSLSDLGMEVTPPVEAAKKVVSALRKNKVDLIIALTQLERRENEELAQKISGIHFILSGHRGGFPVGGVQGRIAKRGETLVVQAHNQGRSVERLDLTVKDGICHFVTYSQRPEILEKIERLQALVKRLGNELQSCSSDLQKTEEMLGKLGSIKKELEALEGCSHYASTKIDLDRTIEGRLDIEAMVNEYKKGAEKSKDRASKDKKQTPVSEQADVPRPHDHDYDDDDYDDAEDEEDEDEEDDDDEDEDEDDY